MPPTIGPVILLAMMASGLNGQKFAFQGYLPVDAHARTGAIKKLELESRAAQQTQLFIETPYRNMQMLEALAQQLHPETQLCVAVDLTLDTESIQTMTVADWRNALRQKSVDLHKRPALFLFLAG